MLVIKFIIAKQINKSENNTIKIYFLSGESMYRFLLSQIEEQCGLKIHFLHGFFVNKCFKTYIFSFKIEL